MAWSGATLIVEIFLHREKTFNNTKLIVQGRILPIFGLFGILMSVDLRILTSRE